VVFSVMEPAYNEKEQISDLWIVRADGSDQPQRLTHTAGSESGLAWSPDSRRLLFTAKRGEDEVNQA
jgi:Tol biopolymer transport system component